MPPVRSRSSLEERPAVEPYLPPVQSGDHSPAPAGGREASPDPHQDRVSRYQPEHPRERASSPQAPEGEGRGVYLTAGALAATAGTCANLAVSRGAPPTDLDCMVGSVAYYRARHDDFAKRHPDLTPPAYYLSYGEKYAQAFTGGTIEKLSPEGRAWLTRTFQGLQQAIEDKRRADPSAFDALERNPDAFKAFAYETHPSAYLQAGLKDLPVSDLIQIGLTPDLADLINPQGLAQVFETAKGLEQGWVENAKRQLLSSGARMDAELRRTLQVAP